MVRLLRLTELRLPFTQRHDQLVRQRQWLLDLDHLLEPAELPVSASAVAEQIDGYLTQLLAAVATAGDELDQQAATQINQTFRSRWWGLFTCYQVDKLPRTNNDLETFFRRLKTSQRRITGRKNVHDFIVRYGCCAACIDDSESQDALLARLQQVPYPAFVAERTQLVVMQELSEKRYRFRHRQTSFLLDLETRWAAACATAAPKS